MLVVFAWAVLRVLSLIILIWRSEALLSLSMFCLLNVLVDLRLAVH
jgi:hypothetical protein